MNFRDILQQAGVPLASQSAGALAAHTPVDGSLLTYVALDDAAAIEAKIQAAARAFREWRAVPAPTRGELVRRFAERVRRDKVPLGRLISLESGKILTEGLGEVQEVIDICDFAVGLSRQLYGLTIASERPGHHLIERWHPLGPVGVITAFNFPMAVWAWNAALALVCGNTVIWKPSEKTPLCALALHRALSEVIAEFPGAPADITQLVMGRREAGEQIADHAAIPLVSATGSTGMGRVLGPRVAARFGRALLELGGNNAAIVTPTADLALSLRAIVFAAAGTAGQRCTTLRRLIVHRSLIDKLGPMLRKAYASLPGGLAAPGRHPGRTADRRRGLRAHASGARLGAPGGRDRDRRGTHHGCWTGGRILRAPGAGRGRTPVCDHARGNLRTDPVRRALRFV